VKCNEIIHSLSRREKLPQPRWIGHSQQNEKSNIVQMTIKESTENIFFAKIFATPTEKEIDIFFACLANINDNMLH